VPDSTTAVITQSHGAVMVVTLNRPEVLNAIDESLLVGLADALDRAAAPGVRAVVLTGAGRGFCSGADRRSAGSSAEGPGRGLRYRYNPVFTSLAALDKPVVTAVNGVAVGAGLSLALAGDVRIGAAGARLKRRSCSWGWCRTRERPTS
jgi:2-(1,2-epoxy-1,2-dihydrophenyl)acetyl-CoA isomerase